jgi:phage tail-like protein
MKPVEFRRQVFRDAAHWQHPCGISYGLQRLEAGGVALFSRPAFAGWATQDEEALNVRSLAVDDCGRIFWMHRDDCHLYRRDPINGLVERIVPLAECTGATGQLFGRMISAEHRLWVLDRTGSRLITIRPDTFQIIGVTTLTNAIDVSYAAGRLFTLASDGIRIHDLAGGVVGGPFGQYLGAPIALGVDPTGRWIYIVDAYARSFLRYAAQDGAFDAPLGNFDDVATTFRPQLLLVHPDGNLFVSDGSPVAHEFATDGSYIGPTGDVSPLSAMLGFTVTKEGEIFVGSPAGIARFSRDVGVAGNKGQFYTRTLDNGTDRDEAWHRLDLAADIDAGGAIDVYYASADDEVLARAVSGIFHRNVSQAEKVRALESVLQDRWIGPHELRVASGVAGARPQGSFVPPASHSVLFRPDTRRYLWLKLELSGLAPRAKASLHEMRVYYPRLSYLRYLPAVYQHDEVSRDFLERFLSMFETIFSGLEATLERIPEVFDPELTPNEFLEWLALWLDLGIEEEWPDSVKRRLVQNAARLYQHKGTPGGLADMIEVVAGTRPIIRESFQTEPPFILGGGVHLGYSSRILRPPMVDLRRDQRTVLGDGSILGVSQIRATTQVRTDPFRSAAHRFTVLLDLPLHRFRRYERGLHRIIRENAPAHLSYDIQLVSSTGLGPNTIVGTNFRVASPPPFHLGYSTLGRSICTRSVWYGPELGMSIVTGRSEVSNALPHVPTENDDGRP